MSDRRASYLPDRRILIFRVDNEAVDAVVVGDRISRRVWWSTEDGWHCTCDAITDRCGHVAAVRTVVVLSAAPTTSLDDVDDED